MADVAAIHYARSADGTNIAYQLSGTGPLDLVFMIGAALPIDLMWDDPGLTRVRTRLAAFTRTIWFEHRGVGSSGGDPVDGVRGDRFDDDLMAVLEDADCGAVVLVAATSHGAHAIAFTAAHPDRVRSLVLVDTYAHYLRDADCPWGVPVQGLETFLDASARLWGTTATVAVVAPSRADDERFCQWWARCSRLGGTPEQLKAVLRVSFQRDVRPLLSGIDVPTLVLHRQGDRFIRADAGRYLAEHIPGAKLVLLPGDDHFWFVGDSDALVDAIEEFLTGRHQAPEGDIVLATVLFTDIVGSTREAARLGPRAWRRLTEEHDALARDALQRHRGREIKTLGDGFLVSFDGGVRAVRCAVEIVCGATSFGLAVRAGVHGGEVEVRGDDIAGLSVTIAKRICDLADGGQTLLSETMKEMLVGSDIPLSDHGLHRLKGVPDEWRLWAVDSR
jgi:class 3 adenylate cyclase/pimeloyl-ACP methyl ester carboxylesterase